MKYNVDSSQNTPAYLQLYLQLREDIVGGIYSYGERLPSKRTVSDEVGVSTVTVEHAYALLCDEGYAEARERSGFFVTFRTDEGFAVPSSVPRRELRPSVRTDAAPEFPLSVLTRTMRAVMNDYGERILERSPNCGTVELREAIRKYLARSRGIFAGADQIVIGSGSEYLYGLILKLLGRDLIYAIESPSYKKIEQVYRASGIVPESLPLGHDGIESEALWNSGAQVLHLSPYRSFPSGVTASASKRHEYLRWAGREGRYLIEDDFESEFSVSKKAEETLFSHTDRDNVVYMNTFSKTVSSSFRIGYAVLPKHLVTSFEERLGFYSCTVPTFMQFVLAALLENGDFERHINRVRRKKRKELSGKS